MPPTLIPVVGFRTGFDTRVTRMGGMNASDGMTASGMRATITSSHEFTRTFVELMFGMMEVTWVVAAEVRRCCLTTPVGACRRRKMKHGTIRRSPDCHQSTCS